jgi:ADP-ribose pyrophosphatase YjhB (NUDIX family)
VPGDSISKPKEHGEMEPLRDNPYFLADYEKLKGVKLNPARHSVRNAHEHCEMVAARVVHLADLNNASPEEKRALENLAWLHDIGKTSGTADPSKSVALLPRYGITDEAFTDLVKYHDINLPWFLAHQRVQPASDKAWRKLANKVNVRILCLFMVADRVDCPGGWRTNRPLAWFLDEVKTRKLLDRELTLDDGSTVPATDQPVIEGSAGAALVRASPPDLELLVVKIRPDGYELPKGHLEWDETPERAAARELREEAGLISEPKTGEFLGTLEYIFEMDGATVRKRVDYFSFTATKPGPLAFADKPSRTRVVRWSTEADALTLPLVSEELRPIILKAFAACSSRQRGGCV